MGLQYGLRCSIGEEQINQGKKEIKNGKEEKQEKEDHLMKKGREQQRNIKLEAGRKS